MVEADTRTDSTGKPSYLIISAVWFALTAIASVAALDLFIAPSIPSVPRSIIERLHFSKDIFVAITALLSGGIVGALLSRRAFLKQGSALRTGMRVGVGTAILVLLVNPAFWLVSLASYFLFPFFCVFIFTVSGAGFGVVLKHYGVCPN